MRITETMRLNDVLQAESLASERLAQLTAMASSGSKVSQPSDDPAAYASIVQRDAQIEIVNARQTAATRAASDLDVAESTLDQATSLIERARAIAVQQANGTLDASSRSGAALEVDTLRKQMIDLGNTRGSNGYLFGGTRTDTPPFDANAIFVGNSDSTQVEVADGVLAVSNASGGTAFKGAAGTGRDVFADLEALSSALTGNDVAAIQASLTNLDASHTQLVSARIDAGERAARLHSASDAMSSALTQMQTARAAEANADPATVFSSLQAAQIAYQQALQVNKQILSLASAVLTGN